MSLLPDPSELYATADRITRHAEALRARSSRLIASAAQARWHSTAATAFRDDVAEIAAHMRIAAGRVEDAADALRRHAHRIENELAVVAAAEAAVVHTAAAAVHTATSAVHAVEHAGGRMLDLVGL